MSDDAIAAALVGLENAITRAKNVIAQYSPNGARTFAQVKGLSNEVLQSLEVLNPYGYSAVPIGSTADYLLFEIGGQRDHKVLLGGDDPATRIPGLVAGELGLSDNQGQMFVIKRGGLVIDTTKANLPITVNAGTAQVTINGGSIVLAGGGPAVARVGDSVTCPAGTGHITTGSSKVTSG